MISLSWAPADKPAEHAVLHVAAVTERMTEKLQAFLLDAQVLNKCQQQARGGCLPWCPH